MMYSVMGQCSSRIWLVSMLHHINFGSRMTPIEEIYFCMFSSPVPAQLVPSIWQAFHDGMACVAARMSVMTSEFSAIMGWLDERSPALAVIGGNCGCVCTEAPLLLLGGGPSRLKEPEVWSSTPSNKIQSCQGISSGMSWTTGWKGLCPQTCISWMGNMEGNGAW
ncbi:hypothetical protein BJV74DRAFT_451759 [Russula compacta]|nr:hypothetical protein BJV74DRAFT_451759 [Russula compacta]